MCIKSEIKEKLLRKDDKINTAVLRRDWFRESELHQKIIDITSFLPNKVPLKERIFCILNDITERPKCQICDDFAVFLPKHNAGYSKTCSKQSCRSFISSDKRLQTNITKYGRKVSPKTIQKASERVSSLNQKGRATLKEKYGVSNPGQMHNHNSKVKKTLMERYGVDNIHSMPSS